MGWKSENAYTKTVLELVFRRSTNTLKHKKTTRNMRTYDYAWSAALRRRSDNGGGGG